MPAINLSRVELDYLADMLPSSLLRDKLVKAASIFSLRYTHDCAEIDRSNDWPSLIPPECSRLIYIINEITGEIMWQNGRSERWGNRGVA